MIDEHRIAKIETQKPVVGGQKVDNEQVIIKLRAKFGSLKKLQIEISNKLYEAELIEKFIPFRDFNNEYFEENQLLTNVESISVYQFIKSTNKTVTY